MIIILTNASHKMNKNTTKYAISKQHYATIRRHRVANETISNFQTTRTSIQNVTHNRCEIVEMALLDLTIQENSKWIWNQIY